MFVIGDYAKYNKFVGEIFVIIQIVENKVKIKGTTLRLVAVVEQKDIEAVDKIYAEKIINDYNKKINSTINKMKSRKSKVLFGTILHIDGDKKFLNNCLSIYKDFHIQCYGLNVNEKNTHLYINDVLDEISPDIIVITGHDYFYGNNKKDMNSYENSASFIKTIKIIRKRFSVDSKIIIAGACGSFFEALIANGANFASSPSRINIHVYDPAIIAIKCATTSCSQYIDFESIIRKIENGREAFGGIETKGKMRLML